MVLATSRSPWRTSVSTTMVVDPTWIGTVVAITRPSRHRPKFGRGLYRRGTRRTVGQIEEGARATRRIGERQHGSAVQQTSARAEPVVEVDGEDHLFGRELQGLEPERCRERHRLMHESSRIRHGANCVTSPAAGARRSRADRGRHRDRQRCVFGACSPGSTSLNADGPNATVVAVIDGDTLDVEVAGPSRAGAAARDRHPRGRP